MISLVKFSRYGDDYGRYTLDVCTNSFHIERFKTYDEAVNGCSGVAEELNVGLLKRHQIFIAFYLLDNKLRLYVDEYTFEESNELKVKRTRFPLFPYIKCFEILIDNKQKLKFKYYHFDDYDFPGPLATDIFLYIAKTLKNSLEIERARYFWRNLAAGRNVFTNEFVSEIEEYLFTKGLTLKKGSARLLRARNRDDKGCAL